MNMNEQLIHAAKIGDLEKVKLLIQSGADIRYGNDNALHWASSNGHLDVVSYLKSIIRKVKIQNFFESV